MKPINRILLAIVFLAATGSGFSQSLMTEPGTIQMNASISGTAYNGVYDSDGEIKATSATTHGIFNTKINFGLNEKWTISANLPLCVFNHFAASSDDPGGTSDDQSVFHPGDMEAGIRFGIKPEDNFSAAFTFVQSFGTARRRELSGLNTGYADFNSQLQFHIRYSSNPKLIFQTYMGYLNRNNGFCDEFHAGLSGWYIPSSKWKFEASFNGIRPMSEPMDNSNIYLHGLYLNYSGIIAGAGRIYFTPGSVQTYFGYRQPIRGQFIYAAGMIELGVIFKLREAKKYSQEETPKDDSKARE